LFKGGVKKTEVDPSVIPVFIKQFMLAESHHPGMLKYEESFFL
jgi:hypothetical protein